MTDRQERRSRRRQAAFWTVHAPIYDLLWDNALADEIADAVVAALKGCSPVLDVGAGTGLIAQRLTQAGIEMHATEPSASMGRYFRRRLPDCPLGEERIEELQPGFAFSALLAVIVLHLCGDPARAQPTSAAGWRSAADRGHTTTGHERRAVAQAQLATGVGRTRVLRFIVLHLILAPATVDAGPRRCTPGNEATSRRRLATTGLLVFQAVGKSSFSRSSSSERVDDLGA